jgi:Mlc titration factor MtfA (ptsG expression regulator)
MTAWWQRMRSAWHERQEDAVLRRRAISDLLWRRTIKRFPFLVDGPGRDEARLRRMTSLFLDRKEFSGAAGLVVTDEMAVAVAAQACLPVLNLGLQAYDSCVGIVLHRGQARARREHQDEMGIVHEGEEILAGEAVPGGPVMLSWRDVRSAGATAHDGYNVVIHEFAHVLDMANGTPNGCPLLPAELPAAQWQSTFSQAYENLCAQVAADQPTALDPYAATGPDEFFAVASEAFFVQRDELHHAYPALDQLLARYYGFPPAPAKQMSENQELRPDAI